MKTVLVTGSNGQLAKCLKSIESNFPEINFIFTQKSELDITDSLAVNYFFNKNKLDWCINCAAYTNVDLAETEREKVFKINELGVKNIAKTCNLKDVKLIHISTDFVFDGMNYEPYKETDKTNPVNNYGLSKIKGELAIKEIHKKYFIIRTSWLYSEYGSNFVKTMLKLSKERNDIKVINDQIGSPTYARDLAEVILHFVNQDLNNFGTYHYCNEGNTTWFDFAKEIFSNFNKEIKVNPIPSKEYKTEALRPNYSTLDTTKIKKALNLKIPNWKTSLSQAVPNFLKSQPDILFKR